MCGRARCSLAPDQVLQKTGLQPEHWVDQDKYKPSYNVSPGAWTPVLKSCGATDELQTMKWGLVPSFTKKGEKLDHFRMFNARSETVASKGVFSRLLPRQRCVVMMNGFYEWKAEGSKKQPYYISLGDDQVLMMAGLYDCYTDENGAKLFTYTILTVDSSKALTWLHDRMPALLAGPQSVDAWLHTPADVELAGLVQKVCFPFGGPDLKWHPVTPEMSKPGYDKPDACKDMRQKKGSMASFFKPVPKKAPTAGPASKQEVAKGSPVVQLDARHDATKPDGNLDSLAAPSTHKSKAGSHEAGGEAGLKETDKQGPVKRSRGEAEDLDRDDHSPASKQAKPSSAGGRTEATPVNSA